MDWKGRVGARFGELETGPRLVLAAIIAAWAVWAVVQRMGGRRRVRVRVRVPPGPVGVPVLGNWLEVGNDLNPRKLAEVAKRYGDIALLRMGQRNVVVLSSPNLAKEVLVSRGAEFGSRRGNIVFDIFTGGGEDMVFTTYGQHWRRMRRIMTIALFTHNVLRRSQPAWDREMRAALSHLAQSKDSPTLVRTRLQLMMYNIIYSMAFGVTFQGDQDPLYLRLRSLNAERTRLAQSFEYNYADFIPILRPFARRYLKRCQDVKERRLNLFLTHFLENRRKLLKEGGPEAMEKCAIDDVLEAQERGEISQDNVLYIVENINAAGIETSLWSMEWAIAELVNNPAIQQRLQNELDEVLRDGDLMELSDIPKLPYLQAVIKETLRLHMVAPLLIPHMNLCPTQLGGYDIPAGSKILVNAWWLANNPALWDDPQHFKPERFFDSRYSSIHETGNDTSYTPFGVGRRSCPGAILALPLVTMMIGRLAQCFHLLPPQGVEKLDMSEELGQFTLHIAKHSLIVLKQRNCFGTSLEKKSAHVIP